MCYRISDMGLCKVEKNKTYTLDEFRQAQFDQLREVRFVLKGFDCLMVGYLQFSRVKHHGPHGIR
jgi:hypothetical protein